jgi:hypothetical protein
VNIWRAEKNSQASEIKRMSGAAANASKNTWLQKRLIEQIKFSADSNRMVVTATNQSHGNIDGFE